MLYYEWKSRSKKDIIPQNIGTYLFLKVKTSRLFRYSLIFFAVIFILAILIIPQFELRNRIYNSESIQNYLPQMINNIFNALWRPLFAASVAMIIMSPLTGHNKFFMFALGSKGYVPWARLTFTAYIVHLAVFDFYYNQQRQGTYLHHKSAVWIIYAWIFVTYLISIPISMWFEFPFTQIEKLLMFPGSSETANKKIEAVIFRNMTMDKKSWSETITGNINYIYLFNNKL